MLWRGVQRIIYCIVASFTISFYLYISVRPPSHHRADSDRGLVSVPVRAGHHLEYVPLHEYDDLPKYSLPDVFFSIKSSEIVYPYSRLTPIALTWLRKVPSKNVFIVTDKKNSLTETIARLGYYVYYSVKSCPLGYNRAGFNCKAGKQFGIYYEQVEAGRNNFNWFCQVDDDVYVNTGELEKFLLSRDPNEAHYIGRKSRNKLLTVRKIALDYYANKIKGKNYRQFPNGALYCMSKKLMSEIETYIRDGNLTETNRILGIEFEDRTVAFVIGVIAGVELTDLGSKAQLQYYLNEPGNLKEKVAVSYSLRKEQNEIVGQRSNITNPVFSFHDDPTGFLSYHCLLYPTESWCQSRTLPKLDSLLIG